MTSPFEPFLRSQRFVVLDGGLASALEAAGHALGGPLWSARLLIDAPDAIREVHRAYLEAGADCITTASYQASLPGFRSLGVDALQAEELLRRSTRLACDVRDAFWQDVTPQPGRLRPLVAASVGPYGAYLADGSEYDGRYGIGRPELEAFHRRRFEVLAASGADVLACETIPSLQEAEVLLGILDDAPGTWAWFGFSCRDDAHLHDGSRFADAVRACSMHARVAAVGVNCTEPRFVEALLRAASQVTDLPLLAYPNAGGSYDARAKRWSGATADDAWLSGVGGWVGAGAGLVGGCCRVGPEAIRGVRATLGRTPGARSDGA
jgi:homocysteine S-methyltransferase